MVFRYLNTVPPVHQLRSEMDRLLSGFFGPTSDEGLSGAGGRPAVNVWEDGDSFSVELEVPGLKNDQVEISVVGNELSLKIERPDVRQEGVTYHRRERPLGSVSRLLRLPSEVDADRVEAELHDGVLTVKLPKAESVKPRKIQVASA